MRTKLLVILTIAVLAVLSLPLFLTSAQAHSVGKNSAPLAQATAQATVVLPPLKCDDPAFLKQLSTDLNDFSTLLGKFDPTDAPGVAKTLISTIILRQKYEDLQNVPANCVTSQYIMVDALGNYGDAIALVESTKSDPDNAKIYLDAVPGQIARANDYLKGLVAEVGTK